MGAVEARSVSGVLASVVAHPESRRLSKYAIVGVANVLIDFAIYALLLHAGVWYLAAKALSVSAATLNGYTFNRRWTFRAGRHRHALLVRYLSVQGTGLALGVVLLAALVELAGMGKLVAQLIALPGVALFTFTSNRFWTFGRAVGRG
jgi:putative flippase GtrA